MRTGTLVLMLSLTACGGGSDPPSVPSTSKVTLVPPTPVVFIGDSITQMWSSTLPAEDVDAGVSGNTSAMMLARFQTDVMARHPEVVEILAGTNDIRTLAAPNTDDIATMAHIAATAGACVIIGTLPPISDTSWTSTTSITPQDGDTMLASFNVELHALASAYGYYLADYHTALTLSDGVTQDSSLFGDGLHPNDAGHAAMWAVVDPLIKDCGVTQ